MTNPCKDHQQEQLCSCHYCYMNRLYKNQEKKNHNPSHYHQRLLQQPISIVVTTFSTTWLYIVCTCIILLIRIACNSNEMIEFPNVIQVVESFNIHVPLHINNYHRITLSNFNNDYQNYKYDSTKNRYRKNTAIPMTLSSTTTSSSINNNNNNKLKWNIPKDVKLLILPGFGNDIEDYILSYDDKDNNNNNNNTNSGSLIQSLVNRGWVYNENVYILPIQRYEWVNVFVYGIMDIQFVLYSNAPPTNPAFFWYIQRIIITIQEQIIDTMKKNTNDDDDNTNQTKIILIGHSAGGWLGRAALGYICSNSIFDSNNTNILFDGIVTLGTPNLSPPSTEMDMTRGALRYTNEYYPNAYQHYQNKTTIITTTTTNNNNNNNNNNTIFYITVGGETVQGIEQVKKSWIDWIRPQRTTISGFAYNSYKAVCGNGTMIGDGVVPICSAHLQNAIQLTIPNVYHSINVPDQWYGSETVIDTWYNVMMEQIVIMSDSTAKSIVD